jgi:hypothetical protein
MPADNSSAMALKARNRSFMIFLKGISDAEVRVARVRGGDRLRHRVRCCADIAVERMFVF